SGHGSHFVEHSGDAGIRANQGAHVDIDGRRRVGHLANVGVRAGAGILLALLGQPAQRFVIRAVLVSFPFGARGVIGFVGNHHKQHVGAHVARAKWERYKDGADDEALSWLTEQSQKDTRSGADTNVRQMADPTSAVNINMGTLVGSYASVARMLDEVAAVPGAEGVLLTFDDFLTGVETFGERIQPLMQCRAHIPAVTKEVA
ncbi:hypothetical protein VE19_15395, partial [Enterobacter hormaechei]